MGAAGTEGLTTAGFATGGVGTLGFCSLVGGLAASNGLGAAKGFGGASGLGGVNGFGCVSGLGWATGLAETVGGPDGRACPVLPPVAFEVLGCAAPNSVSTMTSLGFTRSIGMVTAGGGVDCTLSCDACEYMVLTTASAVTSAKFGILIGVVCPCIAILSDSASFASRFIHGSSARLGLSFSKLPQIFSLSSTHNRKCSRSALTRLGSSAKAAP